MNLRSLLLLGIAAASLGACASPGTSPGRAPTLGERTPVESQLQQLPPPVEPVAVAVYGFTDQTGQFKPSDTVQTFSRAVSQGASSMLVKSLQDAGHHRWFTVVEREELKNLLQERQIITEMRARYLGEKNVNPEALPALLFAGVLLEGGVIGYDTNTLTGGASAALLGIGASTQYRQDTITVYLRAVSVKTGEVLTTVTSTKTVASYQLGANAFRYVAFEKLLDSQVGFTTNEPAQIALQQAIDKAVYGLIFEGVESKLWDFSDSKAGWPYLWRYRQERDGVYTAEQIQRAESFAPPNVVATSSGAAKSSGRPPVPAAPLPLGAGSPPGAAGPAG